jgi:hypothetical protein
MPNINRLPLGLLGFLGIKNGGRYPQELSDTLAPTWDLSDIYLNANAENRVDVLAIAALGSQAFFTVPAGEAWYVIIASAATGTLGAGVTIELGLQTTDAAALVTTALTQMSGARTVGQRCAVALERGIYLPPGSTFGINCTQLVAGPVNVTLATRFARFQL